MSKNIDAKAYNVTFVFDYTNVSIVVVTVSEEYCEELAIDLIKSDTGMPENVFKHAQDILIEELEGELV